MDRLPTPSEILDQPRIAAGLRDAYHDSDVGGSRPVEQGGFILRDPATGELDVARLAGHHRDSFSYPIRSDGTFDGKEIVGSFHTHPNTGTDWMQEPSPQDVRLSTDYPETMGPHQFVISKSTIYHIDNAGTVTEMGSTRELLELPE